MLGAVHARGVAVARDTDRAGERLDRAAVLVAQDRAAIGSPRAALQQLDCGSGLNLASTRAIDRLQLAAMHPRPRVARGIRFVYQN